MSLTPHLPCFSSDLTVGRRDRGDRSFLTWWLQSKLYTFLLLPGQRWRKILERKGGRCPQVSLTPSQCSAVSSRRKPANSPQNSVCTVFWQKVADLRDVLPMLNQFPQADTVSEANKLAFYKPRVKVWAFTPLLSLKPPLSLQNLPDSIGLQPCSKKC